MNISFNTTSKLSISAMVPSTPILLLLILVACWCGAATAEEEEETCDLDTGECQRGGSGKDASITKDYDKKASHYDKLWGRDNLHIGYYPHLDTSGNTIMDKNISILSPSQSAAALTERMIQLANIRPTDRVLDLGSGKGLACKVIAETTGASCTGLDLTTANVERSKSIARDHPNLKLSYFEGSFTKFPEEVLEDGPYDVIFSQIAFCHAHNALPVILQQVLRALKDETGRFVVNDYLGGDKEPGPDTYEHIYKRLKFSKLHGHWSWRNIADGIFDGGARLELMVYENLNAHMLHFYQELMKDAAAHNEFESGDGSILTTNYNETAKAITKNEIGMNLALYTKKMLGK